MPLLEVDRLQTSFFTDGRIHRAVDDVSFFLNEGETVCLVGESGCGKSATALSILGLIDAPGRITGGAIRYRGRDLTGLDARSLREVRGRQIAMIFQEPMTSLNPVLSIGHQLTEVFTGKGRPSRRETGRILDKVGLDESVLQMFPHQLSGGQRQRVMIAMALIFRPAILIADEPTTALDVTIQAQILMLLGALQREFEMAILLITHNFGVVAEMADRVLVMYAGKIIESGPTQSVITRSRHPYTQGLLKSVPRLDSPIGLLPTIEGTVPDSSNYPSGCRFHPRCAFITDRCRTTAPELVTTPEGHGSACWEADRLVSQ